MTTGTGLGGRGHSPDGEGGAVDALTDMAEALTALGNYLQAAHRMIAGRTGTTEEVLVEALEKALEQQERCASALRRHRVSPDAQR